MLNDCISWLVLGVSYFHRLTLYGSSQVADDGGVQPGKQTSLRRNMGSEFSCMIKEAKVIASTLGILCLDG